MTYLINIIYDSPQWLSSLAKWFTNNSSAIIVAVIAGVVVTVISLIIQHSLNIRAKKHAIEKEKIEKERAEKEKTQKWREETLRNIPRDFFSHYPNKNYIQPYFSFAGQEEKQPLKDYFLEKVFVNDSTEHRLFCLLGDTGTGKTAALVNLYADYINSHSPESPYRIQILSLRNESAFNDIEQITEKNHCILLLDAMDENPMAQNPAQRAEFDNTLNRICEAFAFVVITCRPQFFFNEEELTNQVKIQIGEDWDNYTLLQLSPFDKDQVKEFLDHVFPAESDKDKRQKAEEIVNKHALIAIRPLVLTHTRDIVDSNHEINTTLDFYDTIVQSWIQRELRKTSPDNIEERTKQWWEMTSQVAGYLYQKTNGTNKEPSFKIDELNDIFSDQNHEEFASLLSDFKISLQQDGQDNMQFLQRSMLTRTGDTFHFSHKSFYEYFMAYRFFLYYGEIKQVYGMDFALQLYDELNKTRLIQSEVLFHAKLMELPDDDVANSLHEMGSELQKINHFTQAEAEFNEALAIRRQLADNNPDAYLPYVAHTLNNLANLHSDTNRHQEAEEEYNEALTIRRQLAEKNPDAYLPDVATTLNNLALLHSDTNRHQEAEEEYNEALTIYRQLADNNPDAYLPAVASTLNNLANLHKVTNRHQEAEAEHNEALTIRRQLADNNPDAYLPDLAMTLNNLAALHYETNRHQEAEAEYNEALTTYRQLADNNPDAYLPAVADTLNNLASLHRVTNRHQEAEEEYNEALTIRRQLADNNPDAYLPDVAQTLYNIALLHIDQGNLPSAEAAALESLEKYRIMAEKSHEAFDQWVKRVEKLLEIIRQMMKENK